MKYIIALLLLIVTGKVTAQENMINPKLLQGSWPSSWITCPGVPQREYGIYHFRKKINLSAKPSSFVVHVTADNRYRLFVNGKAVCYGPARGDLYNWYFETVDIAPYLSAGENIIAALVWNMGTDAPVAQVSNQTGFVMQGNTDAESMVNTDKSWKVLQDRSYKACSKDNGARLQSYMVIGPGDEVDGSTYPWGWESAAYNDAEWKNATTITNPVIAGYGTDNLWTLTPRNIPLMEERSQRIPVMRRSTGIEAGKEFLTGNALLTIAANKNVTILLDQTFNTVAYPELVVSGGKGSQVKLTYAEALFKNREKGNRNDIEGKEIIGNYDIFKSDGGSKRLFRPLWVRTFRYLQLDIQTGDEPLEINDLYGMYTCYPFKAVASFSSNDTSLQSIWNVGWRTTRLCADETYYDCPYYEQLQYEGAQGYNL